MTKKYKLENPFGVVDLDTKCWIPFDLENTDYQKYLAWLEEGNTPEAAD